jgi:hypothetical protein
MFVQEQMNLTRTHRRYLSVTPFSQCHLVKWQELELYEFFEFFSVTVVQTHVVYSAIWQRNNKLD